jgi:CelD/BcsL family acetyltransferase involved in cellulose biosynthesis
VAERGYEEAVVESLADAIFDGVLGRCDQIVLSALDGEQSIDRALARAVESRGMAVEEQSTAPSPYVRLPGTWEAYLAALSGSGRYLLTRSLRDFDRWAGPDVDLARVTSLADLEEGKKVMVRLHEQRWQAAGQRGVFASRLFSQFHDTVMPALLEQHALDLCWLRVRGEPVAVAYNIVWDNKVLFYQGGRTLELPKGVRAGIVLHARSIRTAIESGRSEYDFLPGTSQYKLQLATASRPTIQIRATRAPLRDLACAALERGAAYIRQRGAQAAP